MATISSIDDTNLIQIFSNLPIRDLFKLARVCRRWKDLYAFACHQKKRLAILAKLPPPSPVKVQALPPARLLAARQLLAGQLLAGRLQDREDEPVVPSPISPLSVVKILHNNYGMEFAHNADRIRVKQLTEFSTQVLVDLFPNITELEIVENTIEPVVDLINDLLLRWTILSKLKVIIVGSNTIPQQEAWNLLALSINTLTPFLRHLTLYDHNNGCPLFNQFMDLFSIEEFFCGGFSAPNPTEALALVNNFIPIRNFGLFGLNYTGCTSENVCDNLQFPFQAGQVHKLIYCPTTRSITGNFLRMAASSFSSLGALHITNTLTDFNSLYYFVQCISSMVYLRELRMSYFPQLMFGEGMHSWINAGKPIIPSLTHLHLDCEFMPHAEFENMDQLFPLLAQIKIVGHEYSCRGLTEADYPFLGTQCYPTIAAFRLAIKHNLEQKAETVQLENRTLLKNCEDHFMDRPVLLRMPQLRELLICKKDPSVISNNQSLFAQFRVVKFSNGRRVGFTSAKYDSL